MRNIETMNGYGTVTSNHGEQVAVRYELHVYKDEIPAGTLAKPYAAMPGLKEIRGAIQPVCFFTDSGLTLEMQDGRKVQFSFTDNRGFIALNSWIG